METYGFSGMAGVSPVSLSAACFRADHGLGFGDFPSGAGVAGCFVGW